MTNKKITIVTTTINSPTEATHRFAKIANDKGFKLVIAGDLKTPHDEYHALADKYGKDTIHYLTPERQDHLFPTLSETIGWRTIQRRNVGYAYAYLHTDADVIATVDDDNIPYSNWGENVLVGEDVEYDCYLNKSCEYFDPLSITKDNHVWHRGYPIQHLQIRHNNEYRGPAVKRCLVQAMLWDGDPDIDAMARLTHKPCVRYNDIVRPYGSTQLAPFNSQNTFLHRSVMPFYAVLPYVGRMDDIWGAYIMQSYFPNSVVYDVATVYQDRNVQDLVTNLENEVIGYRNTLKLIESGANYYDVLPDKTKVFFDTYKQILNNA
jgi:hypothetical protein